ncbi:MAG: (Fe-S)-binding protein [Chitinophagales bacterium]|nr:(Fe-S)-binding protein [Chitinophagales bacterium]
MKIVQIIIFAALTGGSFFFFLKKVREIYNNIMMGRKEEISSDSSFRWKQMLLVAFGQQKMFKRPVAALLHLVIYISFCITQIELLEIFIDGFTGSHRILYFGLFEGNFLGSLYTLVINMIEILSLLTFFVTLAFLYRRNLLKLPRFTKAELKGWPMRDANQILIFEILLIFFIFCMNGGDKALQIVGEHEQTGHFILSSIVGKALSGLPLGAIHFIERLGWWGHICMVFVFMNYLPYSKHLHIALAFPNTYFSRPEPKGEMKNMPNIQKEVASMFGGAQTEEGEEPMYFGAKDVTDLSWKNLLDAYTCTECGRCTAACPANLTGKKLSPRKIMMDTRDRMEDIAKGKKEHGPEFTDNKTLLGDYITKEELRACTTCNACVEECPVNISPLSIILELRRNLIMEQSDSPSEWNTIFSNLENNQAPWQFSPQDRLNWVAELND